jgi:TPR repeat protein
MRRDFVVLIALAFALVFPSCRWPQSATSALVSKSPRVDVKTPVDKANFGDPEAQYQLGLAYDLGLGVDKNEYEAMRWYRLAANSGHTGAQNNLAYLCETGPDGLKDITEAVKWYRRGAIYGDAMAQYNLGRLYLYGPRSKAEQRRSPSLDAKVCRRELPAGSRPPWLIVRGGSGVSTESSSSSEVGEKSC